MQVALPVGQPVDRHAVGVATILLAGIVASPLQAPLPNFTNDIVVIAPASQAMPTPASSSEPDEMKPTRPRLLGTKQTASAKQSLEIGNVKAQSVPNKVDTVANTNTDTPTNDLPTDPKPVQTAKVSDVDELRNQIVKSALAWDGVLYVYGGESRAGVDCSALVQKVYAEYGIELPRSSYEQFRQGIGVSINNLLPGDLVFFSTNGSGASHVGIYIGDKQFLSATTHNVRIQSLDNPYWSNAYRGSKKLIN